MKEYGVNAHRMSLSWSRIIPNGGCDQPVNEEGIAFYRKVIQGLLEAGIVSPAGGMLLIIDALCGTLTTQSRLSSDPVPLGPTTTPARQIQRLPFAGHCRRL